MKNLKLFLFTLVAVFAVGFAVNVNAEEVEVGTFNELAALANVGGEVKLTDSFVMTDDIVLTEDMVLDLNGYSINNQGKMTIIIKAHLTIKDTSEEQTGKIYDDGSVVRQEGVTVWQPLQVGRPRSAEVGTLTLESGTIDARPSVSVPFGDMVINGGTVVSNDGHGIILSGYDENSEATYPSSLTINGGEIIVKDGGNNGFRGIRAIDGTLVTFNDGKVSLTEEDAIGIELSDTAKLVMKDGEITGTDTGTTGIQAFGASEVVFDGGVVNVDNYALTGNGNETGTKFTVNGGELTAANAPAVYAPQKEGITTITAGKLTGGESAVEIRAGELNITGGEFTGNTTKYEVVANGNGTTTIGSAIAVVQHTTKQPINVTISGGKFTGYIPFTEANPHENPYEDISKVSVSISGGEFNATGETTVRAQDLSGFISGGRYSGGSDPILDPVYVAEGYNIFNDAGVDVVLDGDLSGAEITGIKKQTYNVKIQRQTTLEVKLYGQILQKDTDYTVGYSSLTTAGTITMTIKGIGKYTGTVKKTFVRAKAKNPLTVKAANKTVYYSKVKKSAQVVKPITVTNKVGTLKYTKMSGSSTKLLLNTTTGKVTVKKGTKKGKYKISIKVYASGNANYNSNYGVRTVYVTVK